MIEAFLFCFKYLLAIILALLAVCVVVGLLCGFLYLIACLVEYVGEKIDNEK